METIIGKTNSPISYWAFTTPLIESDQVSGLARCGSHKHAAVKVKTTFRFHVFLGILIHVLFMHVSWLPIFPETKMRRLQLPANTSKPPLNTPFQLIVHIANSKKNRIKKIEFKKCSDLKMFVF
jgi:hypothetical protein